MRQRSGLFIFAAWVVTIWGVGVARSFLVPLCLSALLAFLMAPVLRTLRRAGLPEWASVILSAATLILPILALAYIAVSQAEALARDWPSLHQSLQNTLLSLRQSPWVERLHLQRFLNTEEWGAALGSHTQEGLKVAVSTLREMVSAGADFLLVIFFAIVMLASRNHLRSSFEGILLAHGHPEPRTDTLGQMITLMENFLLARISLAFAVGILDFAILKFFGFPYSFFLGAFLGLMTWIPAVGFFLGVLPPIAVGLGIGLRLVPFLVALGLIGLVQGIQDHFATPKFVGHQLNLNFLATYLALFAGERLWGAWGMFLAIPMLGIIRIALSASPALLPWARLLSEEGRSPKPEPSPEPRGAA